MAEVSVEEIELEGRDQQTYSVLLYEIEYDLPESVDADIQVMSDPELVKILFQNLLNNAFRNVRVSRKLNLL